MLEDIYLYPDAKKVIVNKKSNKTDQIFSMDKIILNKKADENINLFIFGAERSGKSALCKTAFTHYYTQGYIPIYLEAIYIKGTTISDFNKLVYKAFNAQYSESMLERFKQTNQNKKIIIIDDLEKCKQGNKLVLELLEKIKMVYPNIIVTGNEMLKFSNLLIGDENDVIDNFEKFELIQFGHLKRSKLIEKWNRLGQVSLSEKEMTEKHDLMTSDINTVIGNNFVPSYPFFLLILLQSAESGLPHNNKDSAYGYYYELLITQSFINIDMQHKEIDAYYTYIAEMAYHFYANDIYEFSEYEFREFNEKLSKKYDLTYDFERTIKKLLSSSVIEIYNQSYRFKYIYIYYYFVAKYFSNKITDEKIRDTITIMCKSLHVEEYSNILMFLTHLSKDPFILNSLYIQAQKIFNEYDPTKLENDILLLNDLAFEIPKIVYQNIEVKKHREDKLIAKDEVERNRQETATTTTSVTKTVQKDSAMDAVWKAPVHYLTQLVCPRQSFWHPFHTLMWFSFIIGTKKVADFSYFSVYKKKQPIRRQVALKIHRFAL